MSKTLDNGNIITYSPFILTAMCQIKPPESEAELLQRAKSLNGKTLQQIANQIYYPVPTNISRTKGWVGQLLEAYLGATAGSKATPDFPTLSIELKTLPINIKGKPKESTFICNLQLNRQIGKTWHKSAVWDKLQRILWIPIEGLTEIPITKRHVGSPTLWIPNKAQEKVLKKDWEELMEQASLGQLDEVNANIGTYLQIRPKAANSQALTTATNHQGEPIKTLPKGFYLRTSLTMQILMEAFES